MSGKRSHTAYKTLWASVIEPALQECIHDGVRLRNTAKEDVWRAYVALNSHTSQTYMADSTGLLDRHKVAACYTFAVLMAMPLVVEGDSVADHLNERVALHTGCSVLASYLAQAVGHAMGFDDASEKRALERIAKGIEFPDVGHGETYEQSVLNCLTFTQLEGNYNVLLLALLYYDWELRLMNPHDHDIVIRYYCNKTGKSYA